MRRDLHASRWLVYQVAKGDIWCGTRLAEGIREEAKRERTERFTSVDMHTKARVFFVMKGGGSQKRKGLESQPVGMRVSNLKKKLID